MAATPDLALAASTAFVGRVPELQALAARLQNATAGTPAVILLSGDAGIGKSRLAHELTARAQGEGFLASFGRFIEDGPLPFAAFAGALIPAMANAGILDAGSLGAGAELLLRLHTHNSDAAPAPSPGQTAMIGQAIARGVILLAAQQPRLIVLDDLQWAGAEALDTFASVALALADAAASGQPCRAILIGIHRPVDRDDPLARRIERLRRESTVEFVRLDGLDELETNELIRGISANACAPALLGAIETATHGNPLFIFEALDALAAEGALRLDDGRLTSDIAPAELPLPAEVTRAVRARVEALAPPLRRLIVTAALVGDGFTLTGLSEATGQDEAALLEHLEAAIGHRIIAESGDDYRFAHPLIRAAATETLTRARRRREHAAIAARLIALHDDDPDYTLEIAHHLLSAGTSADAATLGRYARRAGEVAFADGSWSDSARYLGAALEARPFIESLDAVATAHLFDLAAEASHRLMDYPLMRSRFALSVTMHRANDDVDGWANALVGWSRSFILSSERVDDAPLTEFLKHAGEGWDAARARVLAFMAEVQFVEASPHAVATAEKARALGLSSGNWLAAIHADLSLGSARLRTLDAHGALSSYREALELAGRSADPWLRSGAMPRIPLALLALGRLEEADAAADAAARAMEELEDWAELSLALSARVAVKVARGEFDEAERLAVRATAAIARSDYAWSSPFLFSSLAYARRLQGRDEESADALEMMAALIGRPAAWALSLFLQPFGTPATVAAALTENPGRVRLAASNDVFMLGLTGSIALLAEVARLPEVMEAPMATLKRAEDAGIRFAVGPPYLLSRIRAHGERMAGNAVAAERAFQEAIDLAIEQGAHPERALAQLELARLCFALPAEALRGAALLAEAARTFDELGMHPALADARKLAAEQHLGNDSPAAAHPRLMEETHYNIICELAAGTAPEALGARLTLTEQSVGRALSILRGEHGVSDRASATAYLDLEAGPPPVLIPAPAQIARAAAAFPTGFRAFFFTDVVDSTPLQQSLGDERYVALLGEHDRTTLEAIARHNGTAVKHTGDGFFAWFPDTAGALECALELRERMPIRADDRAGATEMWARIGVHAGEAIQSGDDLFGIAVSIAARVCHRAGAGEILVSEPIRLIAAGGPFAFSRRGRFALKGIAERVVLYEVHRRDAAAPAGKGRYAQSVTQLTDRS